MHRRIATSSNDPLLFSGFRFAFLQYTYYVHRVRNKFDSTPGRRAREAHTTSPSETHSPATTTYLCTAATYTLILFYMQYLVYRWSS